MSTMSSISSALSGLQKADQMLLGAAQAVNGGLDNMAEAAVQLQTAQVQASASLELLRTSLELEGQIVDLLA
jgi:hypothetical protein